MVTIRASERPVTEADTDSSRDKRSDIPVNASERAGPGQTNEKVIHRNTIIIIIDARLADLEQRPRERNIAATTRARGEELWDREAAGVSASFPHFSLFYFSFGNERTRDGGVSIRREREFS